MFCCRAEPDRVSCGRQAGWPTAKSPPCSARNMARGRAARRSLLFSLCWSSKSLLYRPSTVLVTSCRTGEFVMLVADRGPSGLLLGANGCQNAFFFCRLSASLFFSCTEYIMSTRVPFFVVGFLKCISTCTSFVAYFFRFSSSCPCPCRCCFLSLSRFRHVSIPSGTRGRSWGVRQGHRGE